MSEMNGASDNLTVTTTVPMAGGSSFLELAYDGFQLRMKPEWGQRDKPISGDGSVFVFDVEQIPRLIRSLNHVVKVQVMAPESEE